MSWLTDVRYGVGGVTASEHPTLFQFQSSGTYVLTNGLVPIVGIVMPEEPAEVVSLDASVVAEGIETVVRLQFRFRAATEARLDTMEDALADTWQNRRAGQVGDATLILSSWSSGAALGQDGTGRVSRSANYYMTFARPLAHRN